MKGFIRRIRFVAPLVSLMLALVLAPQTEAKQFNSNGNLQSFKRILEKQVFKDNFNGNKIDPRIWNTGIATSGNRWCSSTVQDHASNPGQWLDVSVQPYYNLTQTPPYGAITVAHGQASFSAGPIRTFPYIWRGPPSKKSPFPETGDFIFETRIKYDSVQPNGSGLNVVAWGNTEPAGNNPPIPFGGKILQIWAGTDITFLNTQRISFLPDPLAYHIYRLEYVDGKYSLFIDGALKAGPTASNVRPNTIWLGNPVFTFWGIFDWSDFTIDYVRVTAPYKIGS